MVWCEFIRVSLCNWHAMRTHAWALEQHVYEVLTCDHSLSNPAPCIPYTFVCVWVCSNWMRIESFGPCHATNNLTPHYKSSILSLAIKSHFVIYFNECNFIHRMIKCLILDWNIGTHTHTTRPPDNSPVAWISPKIRRFNWGNDRFFVSSKKIAESVAIVLKLEIFVSTELISFEMFERECHRWKFLEFIM